MAEDLGVAVLRVTARTDEALKALQAFQAQAAKELSNIGQLNFSGLEQSAAQAGQRTGRALAQGVTQATQGIRFDNLREALDFSGALNGTLSDLRQYRAALVALREVTPATANGFGQLNDVIAGVTQAIRNYTSSTDQLQNAAAVEAIRAQTGALREQQTQLDATVGAERELVGQTQQVEQSQRAVATATRIATQALRDQVAALGSLAQKGVSDVAGTVRGVGRGVGAVGRGVGAVAKGAVNLGRAGYGIGAELGIFEDPKPGKVTAAIQQVIDRFKFLGEQAQTTRGKILRSIEAVGTAAGFVELARNADLIKASLSGVDIAAQTASKGLGLLDKVGGGFLNFLSNRFPDTAIGELARLGAGATDAAAGIGSATSSLTSFASQGLAASLDGLQAFIDALGAVPPEAQAAVLALAGLSIGFKEKPIVEGLTRVLEYLDGLSDKALKVRGDLNTVLGELSQFQDRLNNANQQKLLPAFTDRGLQPLDNAVNEGESLRRITDAIAGNWERGARFLEKSNDELRRLIDQGLLLRPLSGSPVVQTTNLLPPGAPASSLPNPRQYDRPIGPQPLVDFEAEERAARNLAQQEQDLADVQQRRAAVQESLLQLEKAEQQAASRRAQAALKQLQDAAQIAAARNEAIRSLREAVAVSTGRASPIDGRLGQDRFIPGSPAFREQRRRRLGEAGSNALIGGAFPLLFGQGIGASIGGAAGGGLGGFAGGQLGFGLSLLGTAVGAQFDLASQKAQTLASALNDPIGKFSELQQAALLSSKNLENQVAALIATGRQAEAAAIIQRDLADTYGSLDNAKELANQTDTLQRAFGQLGVRFAEFGAGPLAKVVELINRALGGAPGDSGAIGNRAFRDQVDAIAGQYGRDAGRRIILRQFAAEANQVRQDRLGSFLGPLSFGLFGKSQGARTELANKEALDYAKSQGLITAEQRATNSLLAQAAALRKQIYELSLKQIDADAGANKALQNGLKFDRIQLETRQKLFDLLSSGNLFDKSNPQQFGPALPFSPEASKALEDQVTQRRQLLALQAQAAKVSSQELAIAKATTGLGREAAAIVRQRLEFQQRFKDLQAERQTTSDRFAAVMANPRATNDERVFAANAFIEAANNVKLAGIDFYNKIIDATKQARDNLLSASLNRAQQLGNRDQGLNRFLAPSIVEKRQFESAQKLNEQLKPVVKQYWSSFSNETRALITRFQASLKPTVIAGTINGQPVAGYNAPPSQQDRDTIAAIIQSAKEEQDSKQALIDANNAVVASNQALSSGAQALAALLPNLATIMNNLAGKDWTVNVNVPGGSASGAVIGNVNGGLGR